MDVKMSHWGKNVRNVKTLTFCASSEDLCSYSSIRALSTHTSKKKKEKEKYELQFRNVIISYCQMGVTCPKGD